MSKEKAARDLDSVLEKLSLTCGKKALAELSQLGLSVKCNAKDGQDTDLRLSPAALVTPKIVAWARRLRPYLFLALTLEKS